MVIPSVDRTVIWVIDNQLTVNTGLTIAVECTCVRLLLYSPDVWKLDHRCHLHSYCSKPALYPSLVSHQCLVLEMERHAHITSDFVSCVVHDAYLIGEHEIK